ncbi:MAG: efflux RND transporter periplasmic adaptor subunit [Oligoflexales bacterium]|nr:efflux RND transporter periplasmic adaptor subunit [Oligoflexales bacterium]
MSSNGSRNKRSGKKKWALLFAVVIAGVGLYAFYASKRAKEKEKPEYIEAKVERGSIDVTILATGVVQPENRLDIKPPVAGRVDTILVKEGQRVRKGDTLAWMSSTERAALLDAARSKGEEEYKHWEELYRPTPILAPINGTIIQRNVESGQTFTTQDAVFVLSDRLTVKTQVDETDIAEIKLKQPAKVVLDAYPDKEIDAHVDHVAFDAKTVNNVTNYIVEVLPDQTPDFVRSGMTANVTFFVKSKDNILVVKSEFVKVEDNRYSVLVKGDGNEQVKERRIEVGVNDGQKFEIVSGLSENEVIFAVKLKKKGDKQNIANPFTPMGRIGGKKGKGGPPH